MNELCERDKRIMSLQNDLSNLRIEHGDLESINQTYYGLGSGIREERDKRKMSVTHVNQS